MPPSSRPPAGHTIPPAPNVPQVQERPAMPSRSLALPCCLAAARADDGALRYLPSDTKVVLSIHFPALDARERAGAQRLFDELYRTHIAPELGEDAKLPIRDVRRVVLGLPYAGSIHGVCV